MLVIWQAAASTDENAVFSAWADGASEPQFVMRLLLVVRSLGLGGTERRLIDLACALQGRVDVGILSYMPIPDAFGDLRTTPIPVFAPQREISKLDRLRYFRHVMRNWHPEIVHAFDLESGIYARAARDILRGRSHVLSGTGASEVSHGLAMALRMPWLWPDRFVCNSYSGARALRGVVGDSVPVEIIRNGMPEDRCVPLLNTEYPWEKGAGPVVGYIGKFDNIKHGERIAELALSLASHPARPTFVLVGGGPNLDDAKRSLALCRELDGRTYCLGPVPDAARMVHSFDIGVLCSDSEGFPNVLLEYMSAGVPIVSTDVGDVADILREAGLVVPAGDMKAFEEAVTLLVEDSSLRTRIGEAGRGRFKSNFTFQRMLDEHTQLYERLERLG